MLEIHNLRDVQQYLDEVVTLEYNEWAINPKENYETRVLNKRKKLKKFIRQ